MPCVEPWVLGVSASHNGAACLLRGNKIEVAVQEERLSRIKRHRIYGAGPSRCISYCLQHANIEPSDLDLVVLSCQGKARSSLHDPLRNPQLKLRLHGTRIELLSNHAAHAMSAYATSGFAESAILVIDGMGSPISDLSQDERATVLNQSPNAYETVSIYHAADTVLSSLEKHAVPEGKWLNRSDDGMSLFGSLGGMFAATAQQIFGSGPEAGKVMGLAAFGDLLFEPKHFWTIRDNGSLSFSSDVPLKIGANVRWPAHRDLCAGLACSVQKALEEAVIILAQRARTLSGSRCLCYAGGVALNGMANERLLNEAGFENVHIVPFAEDNGAAVGAAFWGLWQLTSENALLKLKSDAFGSAYTDAEILGSAEQFDRIRLVKTYSAVADATDLLCSGAKVGWFMQGSEFGPRALGQRSILCDPRDTNARDTLNGTIKKREMFQPVAPSVLRSEVSDWFETHYDQSPFMLRVVPFKSDRRDRVPAVVHADGTGRLQTVDETADANFYSLLQSFYARTGVPMLVNTSFNGCGEPIVETPTDALRCMMSVGLDACVFSNWIAIPCRSGR